MASGKPTAHIEPSSSAGGPIPTLSISRTRIINVTITKGGVTGTEDTNANHKHVDQTLSHVSLRILALSLFSL